MSFPIVFYVLIIGLTAVATWRRYHDRGEVVKVMIALLLYGAFLYWLCSSY